MISPCDKVRCYGGTTPDSIHLLDEPKDLAFRPALFIERIHYHLFPPMLDSIIWFSTDDAIGLSAASLLVNHSTSTKGLYPVHDHALHYCKLPAAY
jgi:hypothetical protein